MGYVRGQITMNLNDINTAVMFMHACDYEYVILKCHQLKDIPYIKRHLAQTLGEPSKVIDHTFYYRYGNDFKRFIMMPDSTETRGYKSEQVFYVAWKDDYDWAKKCAEAEYYGEHWETVPYLITSTFHIGDVYNMLIRDGMTGQQALDMLSNCEVMSV
jgi:hypothetical protein